MLLSCHPLRTHKWISQDWSGKKRQNTTRLYSAFTLIAIVSQLHVPVAYRPTGLLTRADKETENYCIKLYSIISKQWLKNLLQLNVEILNFVQMPHIKDQKLKLIMRRMAQNNKNGISNYLSLLFHKLSFTTKCTYACIAYIMCDAARSE